MIASAPVIGRRFERERIDAFVSTSTPDARALILRGEPGIGKTTLWRYSVSRAHDQRLRVLVTRPAQEEMPLSGVGLIDLFEGTDLDTGGLALGEPLVTGRVVLDSLRSMANLGPLVLAIDDLQWLDPVSARALRYALRRLKDDPVTVVATVRADSVEPDPLALARILPAHRLGTLQIHPLGLEEIRHVIGVSISRPLLRRIYEASGGNPLYAVELARNLEAMDRTGISIDTLPLPDSLQTAIDVRVSSQSEELFVLLETMSVVGRTTVMKIREMLSPADIDPLLLEGQRQGLIAVDDDLSVRFSHPLIGSAVYHRIDPIRRHELHARSADLAVDADVRARHLAQSADLPDPQVATLLEEAADRANRRGDSSLAAGFVRHSLRLTPIPEEGDMRRRAIAEVSYLSLAGEASRALTAADRLVATLPHGPDRAAVLIHRFEVEDDDLELGDALLSEALEDAGDDQLLRGRVLDMLAWLRGMCRGDLTEGIRCAREGLEIAERAGDLDLRMLTQSSLAVLGALVGERHPDRLADAVSLERQMGEPRPSEGALALSGKLRFWAGDLPGARAFFEEAVAEAARVGNELTRPYRLYDLSLLGCAEGNLATALDLVTLGIEAAEDAEFPPGSLRYPLALVQAWLGEADAARATADTLLGWAERRGERPAIVRVHMVVGLLALSEGAVDIAADRLCLAVESLEAMGVTEPGAFPVFPDAIEALARSGNGQRAEALHERMSQQVSVSDGAWAAAGLERSRGVLSLAAGEPDAALDPLTSAEAAFSQLGFRLEAARAHLLSGQALLRGGHRTHAADVLAEARDRFDLMGAALWEQRASDELARAAPGRAEGELTSTERRVASLVAEGMKNKEIAQSLFLSVATVEAHLTRIYRKLGIRSRGELTRLVTEGAVDLAPDARAGPENPEIPQPLHPRGNL